MAVSCASAKVNWPWRKARSIMGSAAAIIHADARNEAADMRYTVWFTVSAKSLRLPCSHSRQKMASKLGRWLVRESR